MMQLALVISAFVIDLIYGAVNAARWRGMGFTLWILSLIAVPAAVFALTVPK